MLRPGICVIALFLALSAWAQSQPPAPGPTKNLQDKSATSAGPDQKVVEDKRGTKESPLIVEVLGAPGRQEHADADVSKSERKPRENRTVEIVSIAITAMATVIMAIFTIFLARSTKKLWLEAVEAGNTAKRATDIARDAMIAGERAFVFAIDVFPQWRQEPNTSLYTWVFRPTWKNSGDTPTKNFTFHTECALRDTPLPMGFNFNYPTDQTGRGLIPPGATLHGAGAPRPPASQISAQDIIDVQQGKKYLYL